MGGLLVLSLIALYLWLAYKVVGRLKPAWLKAVAILVFTLIPTADAVYGRIRLKQICNEDGGFQIYRAVTGVNGFRHIGNQPDTEWIVRHGYQFVEGKVRSGRTTRVSRQKNGSIVTEQGVPPISQYAFEQEAGDLGDGYRFGEYRVIEISTNEKLSVYKNFLYEGGWIERLISKVYAAQNLAGDCGFGDSWQIALSQISRTLKSDGR